jgi:beta-lactamase class A
VIRHATAVAAAALITVAPVYGGEALIELLEQNTLTRIRGYARTFEGVVGIAAIDLTNGRRFALNGDVAFPQASSIKIPIMMRMFQAARDGEFRLSDMITISPEELAGGSGHLQKALANGPLALTVRELITAMIETSDNTATNKCIEMAKMERVNRMLDEMGFVRTRLRRKMMDASAVAGGLENLSTPQEMAGIVERIYRGKVIDEKAGAEMLEIMKKVKAGIRRAVPPDVETASKPGGVPGVKCESGVVYLPQRPFVLSVMSTFAGDQSTAVEDITRIIYAHFARLGASNEWGHRYR